MKPKNISLIILFASLLLFHSQRANATDERGIAIREVLQEESGKKIGGYRALVIGINDYLDPNIPRLQTAVKDATEVARVLKESYGFNAVTLLLDKEASSSNILKEMRLLATEAQEDDSVLIYYAGHGALDKLTGSGWWLPANAMAQDSSTYIDNSVIQKYIKAIPARHLLLVSDSCFSGTLFGESRSLPDFIDNKYYATLYKDRSRWGMTSGNLTPVSDSGMSGHSVFAYQFIMTLEQNKNPYLTPREIYARIAPLIRNNSEQMPITKPIKNADDQGGEFIFLRTGFSTASVEKQLTKDSPLAVSQQKTPEDEFWEMVKDSNDLSDFNSFLEEFPDGRYARLAKFKIKQLSSKEIAGVEPEMILIKGGCFQMGNGSIYNNSPNQTPVHEVCLNDFYMSKNEITNAQFLKFRPGHRSMPYGSNDLTGENKPVVSVSWEVAQLYVKWLSQKTGKKYRLPTEAEWEYAARAGTTSYTYWAYGHGEDCRHANILDESARVWYSATVDQCNDGFPATAPVGSFFPNDFGLYDMLGNVKEWVQDWYDEKYYGKSPKQAPQGPESGKDKIVRGGSWSDSPNGIAERRPYPLTYEGSDIGLRLVRDP